MESGLFPGNKRQEKGNGPKVCQGKFRLDTRKDFSMGKAVIKTLLINICSKKKGVEGKKCDILLALGLYLLI